MSSPNRSFDEMFEHATPLKPLFYKVKWRFQREKGSTTYGVFSSYWREPKTGLQAGKTTIPFKALDFAKGLNGQVVRAAGLEPARARP